MRVFEYLIIATNLLLTLVAQIPALKKRWQLPVLLVWMSILFTFIHLIFEGQRWQMWPVYAVTAGFAITKFRESRGRTPPPHGRTGTILALTGLTVGTILAILLPVPEFPRPTGPYAIGTVTYHWTDPSRAAAYGDDPAELRELMVQVWYPAEKPKGQRPTRWLDGGVMISRAMARWSGFPSFLIDQTALSRTHSYTDAPLATGTPIYPVVIYVHGWGGFRNINPDQIEALASHGYIVVSADHTYGALITRFPDGRVAHNDPRALHGEDDEEVSNQAANALMKVFAADAQFILDQMAQLNSADPDGRFMGRLDMENVGFFGHSTGGGGIIYACTEDVRCKAIYGQDAWVEPVVDEVIARGLTQPVLWMNSAAWREGKNISSQRQLYATLPNTSYFLSIDGTQHYDFVAVPSFSPLAPVLGVKGPLPAQRVMEINQTYLVAFFDKHLRKQNVPLLDSPSPDYPEVQFEMQ